MLCNNLNNHDSGQDYIMHFEKPTVNMTVVKKHISHLRACLLLLRRACNAYFNKG